MNFRSCWASVIPATAQHMPRALNLRQVVAAPLSSQKNWQATTAWVSWVMSAERFLQTCSIIVRNLSPFLGKLDTVCICSHHFTSFRSFLGGQFGMPDSAEVRPPNRNDLIALLPGNAHWSIRRSHLSDVLNHSKPLLNHVKSNYLFFIPACANCLHNVCLVQKVACAPLARNSSVFACAFLRETVFICVYHVLLGFACAMQARPLFWHLNQSSFKNGEPRACAYVKSLRDAGMLQFLKE